MCLADCLIEPADVEHLKKELPNVKIIWRDFPRRGGDEQVFDVRSTGRSGFPKDTIEKSIAEAAKNPAGDACEVTCPSLAQHTSHCHLRYPEGSRVPLRNPRKGPSVPRMTNREQTKFPKCAPKDADEPRESIIPDYIPSHENPVIGRSPLVSTRLS